MTKFHLPPPKNWQDFEWLCCSLWREIWNDPYTKRYGRSGQEQDGIDVYGKPNRGNDYSGIQCKSKDPNLKTPASKITEVELEAEVEKAKHFNGGNLTEFILIHTGPKNTKIENKVMELNDSKKYSFNIEVLAWEEIEDRLEKHPEVLFFHYRDLIEPMMEVARKSKGKNYLKLYLEETKIELEEFNRVLGSDFELFYPFSHFPISKSIPDFYLAQLDESIVYRVDRLRNEVSYLFPHPTPLTKDLESRKTALRKIIKAIVTIIDEIN